MIRPRFAGLTSWQCRSLFVLAGMGVLFCILLRVAAVDDSLEQARLALQRGDPLQAELHLLRYVALDPESAEAYLVLARSARLAESYEAAERYLGKSAELGAPATDVQIERAMLKVQQGYFDPSEVFLLRHVESHPDDFFLVQEALIRGYVLDFQLFKARESLNAWLERRSRDLHALLWRARVEEKIPDVGWDVPEVVRALPYYQKALELDPTNKEARLRVELTVTRYLLSNSMSEGIERLRQLKQQHPDDLEVRYWLAKALEATCQFGDAEQEWAAILQKQPSYSPALVWIGWIHFGEERLDEAEVRFREALKVNPKDEVANRLLRICLVLRNDDSADKYLAAATELSRARSDLESLELNILREPNNIDYRFDAGKAALVLGRGREAVYWFASVLRRDPDHRPTHLALAEYYRGVKKHKLADKHQKLAGPP